MGSMIFLIKMFAELVIILVLHVRIQGIIIVLAAIQQTIEYLIHKFYYLLSFNDLKFLRFLITVYVNVNLDSITLKINLHALHVTHPVKLVILKDLLIVPLVQPVVLEI
jgi:hypothetical protein